MSAYKNKKITDIILEVTAGIFKMAVKNHIISLRPNLVGDRM